MVFLLLTSCAPSNSIKPERIAGIKKVGIATKLENNDIQVFDRTDTMKRNYGGSQFGAIGGLVEGLILTGMARHTMSKSLNGDPAEINQYIKGINIKELIDDGITSRISKKYDLILPQYFDEKAKNKSADFADESAYLKEAKILGIDTFVLIEYSYGVAAFKDRAACAIVAGKITIYDVVSDEILLRKRLASDDDYISAYRTVDEFVKDNGKFYKEDFRIAADSFSYLVGKQVGISDRF